MTNQSERIRYSILVSIYAFRWEIFWIVTGLAGLIFVGFISSTPRSVILILHLIVLVVCGFTSLSLRLKNSIHAHHRRDLWNGLLFSSGISLFIILLIRLIVGQQKFSGHIANLDFGFKSGGESNLAFVIEGNTLGHWIQGFLASSLAFVPKKYVQFVSSTMTIYPMYNFIKRVQKSASTFASSSFMNNGMEWSMGFLLGHSIISTVELLKSHLKPHDGADVEQQQQQESLLSNDANNIGSILGKIVTLLRQVLTFLLILSVFGASILIPLTWNEKDDSCTNCSNTATTDTPIGLLFIIFLPIPITFIVIFPILMLIQPNLFLSSVTKNDEQFNYTLE